MEASANWRPWQPGREQEGGRQEITSRNLSTRRNIGAHRALVDFLRAHNLSADF